MTSTVVLGIGTNLGDREKNISNSLTLINLKIGEIISSSSVYESEPWGFESTNNFLNMVVKLRTSLMPFEILTAIHRIEEELGRVRDATQYVSRTIDIDILLCGNRIVNKKNLHIPHPLLAERKFVLVPLCEIDPEAIHPVLKKKYSELLKECRDEKKITKHR